ncbi:MAG: hypothetical protein ACRD16_05635 [Thermoanaerobaculia bacterium]
MPEGRQTDVDLRSLVRFAAGLAAVVVLVAVAVQVTVGAIARRPQPGLDRRSPLARDVPPPEPRLQTSPADDMATLRRHELAVLNSYGWVDRAHGVVRIPIEEAKKEILEKGLPSR